jgi:hypothetical protein
MPPKGSTINTTQDMKLAMLSSKPLEAHKGETNSKKERSTIFFI